MSTRQKTMKSKFSIRAKQTLGRKAKAKVMAQDKEGEDDYDNEEDEVLEDFVEYDSLDAESIFYASM